MAMFFAGLMLRSRVISRSYRRNFISVPREAREKSCALPKIFSPPADPPLGDPSRLKGPADSAARREESGPYLRRPANVLQLNPSKAPRSVQRLPLLSPYPLSPSSTILQHLDGFLYRIFPTDSSIYIR